MVRRELIVARKLEAWSDAMASKQGLVRRFSMQTAPSQGNEKKRVERSQSTVDSRVWVQTQKNTFTNWTNDRLKETGYHVEDIQYDLDDGLTLLKLVEGLVPEKKLPK